MAGSQNTKERIDINIMGIFNFWKKKSVGSPVKKSNPNSDSSFIKAYTGWLNNSESITDPYSQNVWAYSAIKAISTNIAGVPFKVRNKSDKSEIQDESNPYKQLFENPHPLIDKSQLWRATSIYFEKDGTCFWLLMNKSGEFLTSEKDIPVTIIPLPKNRICPRYSDNDKSQLVGWEYIKDFKLNVRIPLEFYQVIRFYEFNPNSLVDGFTGLIPAGVSMDTDYKAHTFNQKFFENGTDIGGILTYNGEPLDDNEMYQARDRFEERYKGAHNRGKTVVLQNGFEYKQTGTTHKDMDYADLIKMSREEVIAAINVPKHQVSLYEDTNYATAKVADLAFWQNNLIPKLNYFTAVLNKHLFLYTSFEGFFDLTGVDALKESLAEKINSAIKLRELGYPLNEINKKLNLGMEIIDEEWADTAINVPPPTLSSTSFNTNKQFHHHDNSDNNISNVNINSNNDVDSKSVYRSKFHPENTKLPSEEKSKDLRVADEVYGLTKSMLAEFNFDYSELSLHDLIIHSINNDQKAINYFVKNYEAEVIDPIIPAFTKRMNGYFLKLQKEQLKRFDKQINKNLIFRKELSEDDVEEMLFNGKTWDEILIESSAPYKKEAFERSIDRIKTELGGFTLFVQDSKQVADALAEVTNKIVGINETVRTQIKDTLVEGIRAGESDFKLRDRIRDKFKGALSRVNTITRTETGIAANRVRGLAMKEEKVWKKWASSNDSHVRDHHVQYNALPAKPMKYQYAPGLKYPQDVDCSIAGEVINCRCVSLAVRPSKQ